MKKSKTNIVISILKHTKDINVAMADGRQAKKWKNLNLTVQQFVERLVKTKETPETMTEYLAMSKDKQDKIKDVGAFVGGTLKGGRRRKSDVANRHIITLDLDYATKDTSAVIKKELSTICFTVYSTHKHRKEKPRFRLIVYPDRVMLPEEYQAVSRHIAGKIGIEWFDDTSYDVNRLFYWPSTPSDEEYVFYHNDEAFLDVDGVLGEYGEGGLWKDTSLWPRSTRETKSFDRRMSIKQADPLEKKGVVGAFCRTISIYDALDTHLKDVYKKEREDRYTFIEGTSSSGLVVYDGRFAYSNHALRPGLKRTV